MLKTNFCERITRIVTSKFWLKLIIDVILNTLRKQISKRMARCALHQALWGSCGSCVGGSLEVRNIWSLGDIGKKYFSTDKLFPYQQRIFFKKNQKLLTFSLKHRKLFRFLQNMWKLSNFSKKIRIQEDNFQMHSFSSTKIIF